MPKKENKSKEQLTKCPKCSQDKGKLVNTGTELRDEEIGVCQDLIGYYECQNCGHKWDLVLKIGSPLERRFYETELSIIPWPGGELSFWKEKELVICRNSYQSGEETENDLHFGYDYSMKINDYMKGLKDLEENGSCSIPISNTKEWYDCRLNPPKDTVDMKLQDDGTVEILHIKTPWTVKHILEYLDAKVRPLEPPNAVRDDVWG